MDDYIKRETIRRELMFYLWKHPDSTFTEFVEGLPAADVREAKEGRWLDFQSGPYGTHYATCSSCNVRQTLGDYYLFCPNCGADMGEKDDGWEVLH